MTKRMPNIVLILLDDMGFWTVANSGNHEIKTPNIDKLGARGLFFNNCYCVSPVCSPARASLYTGRIPSQHGVIDWIRKGSVLSEEDRPVEYLAGMRSFTDVLAENDYFCGLIGKWHLGDSYTPQKGFKHWTVTPKGSDSYYGAKLFRKGKEEIIERYLTDELTDDAIAFVAEHSTEEAPFHLSLNYTAPHRPWHQSQHPKEFWDLYDECEFNCCPDLPRHPWQINNGMYPGEDRGEMLRGYSTALSAADAGIGKLYKELERLNIEKDTLVIITSDNGMSLGHHGIYGKGNATYPQNMYDQAVKVPFILVQPGRIEPRVTDALISHYDLCPTILDYLDIKDSVGENLPGKSFQTVIEGKETMGNESVVIFDEYGPVRMLRNNKWKYILRMGDWPDELFDLEGDPEEEHNLIDEPKYEAIAKELYQELIRWFDKHVDPLLDASKQPVFGRGQTKKIGCDENDEPGFAEDWFYQSTGLSDSGKNL